LSFNPFEVELIRLDYDVEAAAHALRKKMLPESFSQMLLRGVAIETILKEDQAKRNNMTRNCKEITKATQKASVEFNQDMAHANQVRKLALNFFDALKSQHQLGKRERCWLECTSILHDIGISQGLKGHHKNSMKLILNDTRLPFTSEERRIVASVARYHRRGNPKQGHYNLATLDRATIRKIALLASLLRVADALDYSHQSMVKALSVKDSAKKVIVQYSATSSLPLEEMAFNKKKDLFTKVFEKKLVLSWKQQ
jgi:exopolyphosphatase/pppGpp-phosphohydrolase